MNNLTDEIDRVKASIRDAETVEDLQFILLEILDIIRYHDHVGN